MSARRRSNSAASRPAALCGGATVEARTVAKLKQKLAHVFTDNGVLARPTACDSIYCPPNPINSEETAGKRSAITFILTHQLNDSPPRLAFLYLHSVSSPLATALVQPKRPGHTRLFSSREADVWGTSGTQRRLAFAVFQSK